MNRTDNWTGFAAYLFPLFVVTLQKTWCDATQIPNSLYGDEHALKLSDCSRMLSTPEFVFVKTIGCEFNGHTNNIHNRIHAMMSADEQNTNGSVCECPVCITSECSSVQQTKQSIKKCILYTCCQPHSLYIKKCYSFNDFNIIFFSFFYAVFL